MLLMLRRGKIQRTPPEQHGFSGVMWVPSRKFDVRGNAQLTANVHMQEVKQPDDIRNKPNGVMTPPGMETLKNPRLASHRPGEQVMVNLHRLTS